MMIDTLENRVLLTASFNPGTGLLTVTGTGAGEAIALVIQGTDIDVSISSEGFNADFPISLVQSILINSAGGADTISIATGLTEPATINSGAGNDVITTGSGNTLVNAGDGSDSIQGGVGNDTLIGDDEDIVFPENTPDLHADTIFGGGGNDRIEGGSNRLIPMTSFRRITGDSLQGQGGNDTIIGGVGEDTMDGGAGIDLLSYAEKTEIVWVIAPLPANPFFLTSDNDPAIMGTGTTEIRDQIRVVTEFDMPVLTTFEQFAGGSANDIIDVQTIGISVTVFGNGGNDAISTPDEPDSIEGGDGNDTILAGEGDSTVNGGGGNDLIVTGDDDDIVTGGDGNDNIAVAGGSDTVDAGGGNDSVQGGAGTDTIVGGAGNDTLHGDVQDFNNITLTGNDTVDGGDGNDLLTGGGGNDTLLGGATPNGADTLQGDAGIDTADYSLRQTDVRLSFNLVHDDGALDLDGNPNTNDSEEDFVTETVEIGIGGSGNDTFVNDTLVAGLGAQTMIGGAGVDTVSYASRTSPVSISNDGVANDGAPGESDLIHASIEVLIGGSASDTLTGSTGNDRLVGGGGNDTLDGGAGNDTLDGGLGSDVMIGGTGLDSVNYADRNTLISVTFDGVANDGAPGEGDNVDATVEVVLTREQPQAPDAPSDLTATILSFSSIRLRWVDNSDNEVGFHVLRRKKTDPAYAVVATLPINVRQYIDTNLEPNTVYVYRVRAFNANGNSQPSDLIQPKTPAVPDVAAASNLTATSVSSTRIDLTWTDNSTVESQFQIWRQQTSVGVWTLIANNAANDTTFTDNSLSPNTEYAYQVRARNEFKDAQFSNTATATTKLASFIVAPSGLAANQLTATSVGLTWTDNSTNETGFAIERRLSGSSTFAQIATTGPSVSQFTDNTAVSGEIYVYRVRGFNGSGNSAYSNEATSNLSLALAKATRVEAMALSPNQVLLTWRDNALIESGYSIERKLAANDDWNVIATTAAGAQSFTDTELIADHDYFYRVRATDGTNFSQYSDEARTRTLELFKTIPNAPTNIKARVDTNAIRLFWRDQSNDELNFDVERSLALDGPYTVLATVARDETTYLDFPLDEGKVYYYRVRATKGDIVSQPTNILKVRTLVNAKTVIYAIDENGSEDGGPLTFRIYRRNTTAGNLTVNYQVSGSATNGTDYSQLGGSVTMLDGQDSATITITPIDDSAAEGDETITITMLKGFGYKPSPNIISATATLNDDDGVSASALAKSPFSKKAVNQDDDSLIAIVLP